MQSTKNVIDFIKACKNLPKKLESLLRWLHQLTQALEEIGGFCAKPDDSVAPNGLELLRPNIRDCLNLVQQLSD